MENLHYSEAVFLVIIMIRVMSVLYPLPFIDESIVGNKVKTGFAFFIAIMLYPAVRPGINIDVNNMYEIISAIVMETLLALMVSTIVKILLSAIRMGGNLSGIQMGLRASRMFDPMSSSTMNSLGRLMNWMSIMFLIVFGFDHFLLRAMFFSTEMIPIGGFLAGQNVFYWLVTLSAGIPFIALQVIAPMLTVIFLIHTSFGLVAKSVPNINVFFLSATITVFIGMSVFMFSLPYFSNVIESKIYEMNEQVIYLLQLLSES